jgi:hypothetical protein
MKSSLTLLVLVLLLVSILAGRAAGPNQGSRPSCPPRLIALSVLESVQGKEETQQNKYFVASETRSREASNHVRTLFASRICKCALMRLNE